MTSFYMMITLQKAWIVMKLILELCTQFFKARTLLLTQSNIIKNEYNLKEKWPYFLLAEDLKKKELTINIFFLCNTTH